MTSLKKHFLYGISDMPFAYRGTWMVSFNLLWDFHSNLISIITINHMSSSAITELTSQRISLFPLSLCCILRVSLSERSRGSKRQSKVSSREWAGAVCADELRKEGGVKTVDPASSLSPSLPLSVTVLLCVTMTTSNLFRFINKHWAGRERSHSRLFHPKRDKGVAKMDP